MTGYVMDRAGVRWQLPPLLAWQLDYTAGVPCDSFWLRFLWKQGADTNPREWVEFQAEEHGERVFTGLVDECERTRDSGGEVMEISGRGMAARLLDNEALGQDYETATLADILRDHVTPYGITVAPGASLPAVSQFSVAVGSSEWSVVYDFARYYGGVAPRFDRLGRLVLTGWTEGQELVLGDSANRTSARVLVSSSTSSPRAVRVRRIELATFNTFVCCKLLNTILVSVHLWSYQEMDYNDSKLGAGIWRTEYHVRGTSSGIMP